MSNLVRSTLFIRVLLAVLLAVVVTQKAESTRLPEQMSKSATNLFPSSKIRLDGAMELPDGELLLLLVPPNFDKKKNSGDVDAALPDNQHPEVVFYSNGAAHVRVSKKGDASTIILHKDLSDKQKKRLLGLHFPSDVIAPVGFVLPKSLRAFIVEVPSITLVDDQTVTSSSFGQKVKPIAKSDYKGAGSVFLTSITSGSITMLDGKTLNKLAEFPTEGTPCSMDWTNGQLYVTDQAKNRILIINPATRRFAGQVDLPPGSAPKGIAALPTGKWMYISESGAAEIVSLETATGKPLVKTKVRPGPGRIALTPDGVFLVVLNVTSGEVTLISTYNQKVVCTIRVGDVPTSLAISSDSKHAYVSNRLSNSVSIVDIGQHKVVGTIKCGQSPTGVALSADNAKLYVASGRENTITEFDTKSLAQLRQMHLPSEVEFPCYLCLLPDGHNLLVSSQSATLAVVNASTMELDKSMSLGHANHEAVWIPAP